MENGTYVALKMTKPSSKKLEKFCKSIGLTPIDHNEMHCTLAYSRKIVDCLEPYNGTDVFYKAKIKCWRQLGNALALELDFPKAEKLNDVIMRMGATSDFDGYIPHSSVCYDYEGDLPDELPELTLYYDLLEVEDLDIDD